VTEAEWLAGTSLKKMLEFAGGKASQRKLRLYAVACHCRDPGPHARDCWVVDLSLGKS
jgi:hypothetical protein